MRNLILVLWVCVLASAFYTANSGVHVLTDQNFNSEVVKSDDIWIVEFFAPWCGHGQQLKPEWEKAAKALKGIVKVGAIDLDQYKSMGSQYDIKGFPTIKFFGVDKKSPIEYGSGRDAQSIVDFVLAEVKKITKQRLSGKAKESKGSEKKQ